MATSRLTMAANGRILIPAEIRTAMGLAGGERMTARVIDGALVLEPLDLAIKRAQQLVAQYVPKGVSLADELIAERRLAAESE